ncbi:N-acetyltransferase [Mycolicibacterium chitae]|uniref:N-acetyltransferase GCN5 n=1 Tax=Mycolicibacterium chitae TaxID=1792 RepID=A0A3S4VIQ9_MYCCI|nr:GNAT family N-acetyltransferase [Mycolicibacterium chitae]BBZ04904.1 N-acetyltransferase [Mycolicibacterium chitae]VEG48527.1 N-acetyltransferase GCN5 [Mycolicibacterium chitae]
MERLSPRVVAATGAAEELTELADVAAQTFPLACPPGAGADDIAEFVATQLSAQRFADYVADPERAVLLARAADGPILGYAMLIRGVSDDPDVQRAVTERPAVELSKMYVLPRAHGGTVSAALMTAALAHAARLGARSVWLGVNQENQRAQRYYAKHGFTISGTKTFMLGSRLEHDYVMVREVMVRDTADSSATRRHGG